MIGSRSLDRQRQMAQVVELVTAIRGRGDRLPVEHAAHRGDRLVEPVEALAEPAPELEAVGLVLELHPGAADPQDGPAAADVVEGRGRLRDDTGIPERVGAHEKPEPSLLGRHRPGRQHRPALEDRLVRVTEDGVEVVPRPEVGVSEPIDSLGRVELLLPGCGLAEQQDSELEIGHRVRASGVMGMP